MGKMIKMNKYIVIFALFFVLFIVCQSIGYKEGYISETITGPNDNTLVINDDNEAIAVINDDEIYINEDVIDDADVNTYYGPYGNSVSVAQAPTVDPNNYILKSQIVPPVCPVCPSLIAASDSNGYDSDDDSNGDGSNGDSSNGDGSNGDGSNGDGSNGNGSNGNGSNGDGSNSNGDGSNGSCTNESCYQGNTYKREVNVKCPPCPPCARCPEPAFDCKKVPTYRESDDRYLPKPILSDFSTFGT